jgi:hypothetical protein
VQQVVPNSPMAAMNSKAGWIARLNARRVDGGGWQLLNPKLTGLFDESVLQNSSMDNSSQHHKAKGHKLVIGVKQAWVNKELNKEVKQQTEKLKEPANAEGPEAVEDYSPTRTKAKKEQKMNRTLDELLGFPLRKKKSKHDRPERNAQPGYASP